MRVIESTATRLVATERHRASRYMAIGLAATITAIGIYQASLGNILAGLTLTALALVSAFGLCRVLGPIRAVFDRNDDTLSIERQCFFGLRAEQHPLNGITRVDVADRETDDRRPQHVVALTAGPDPISLTGPYSNSATHDGVVAQINAWLDSGTAKA